LSYFHKLDIDLMLISFCQELSSKRYREVEIHIYFTSTCQIVAANERIRLGFEISHQIDRNGRRLAFNISNEQFELEVQE